MANESGSSNGHVKVESIVAWTSRVLVAILAWLAIQSLGRVSELEQEIAKQSLVIAGMEIRRDYDARKLTEIETRVEQLRDVIARGQVTVVPREDRRRD